MGLSLSAYWLRPSRSQIPNSWYYKYKCVTRLISYIMFSLYVTTIYQCIKLLAFARDFGRMVTKYIFYISGADC